MRFTSILAGVPFAVPSALPIDSKEATDIGIFAFKPVTEALREETQTIRPNDILFDDDVVTEQTAKSEILVRDIADLPKKEIIMEEVVSPANETEVRSLGDNLEVAVSEFRPTSTGAPENSTTVAPIYSLATAESSSTTTNSSNQSESQILEPANGSELFRASFGCVGHYCYAARREPRRNCQRRAYYLRSYFRIPSFC